MPSRVATAYRAMTAYRMHLRCRTTELAKQTTDSGVAATFLQSLSWGMLNSNEDIYTNIEYVGFIEEILELDYGRHCVVVLVYSWVKARFGGPKLTTKRDDFGFTMVNFSDSALIPLSPYPLLSLLIFNKCIMRMTVIFPSGRSCAGLT